MANAQLGFYFLPKNSESAWINFTENILHTSLTWQDETTSELLEFSCELNNEVYDGDNVIVPSVGDLLCVTNDETRQSIFEDILFGIIIAPGQESTGAWINDENRGHNRNTLTIRQKDFSYTDVNLNYKTPTLLSVILLAILDSSTVGLGGSDKNGVAISKIKLLCADVLVNSFEFRGAALDALKELLTTLKYNFRIIYYCKPDVTLTLKVFGQIEVFQNGSPPNDSAFSQGISNQDIRVGGTPNINHDPNDPKSQPYLLFGESKFNVTPDFDSIINKITVIGLVQNGDTLTRYYQRLGDKRESTFKLGYKFKDIIFAARLLTSFVDVASVPTFTPNITFSIDEFAAEKIENYDQLRADYLVCRVVHDDIEYFYRFTVSGQIVTLGILAYGEVELPEALDYNDLFEMVKAVSIYEDNRDNLEGYPLYGSIKNCQLTNTEATLRFLDDDIPRSYDEVVIYGYKLEDYKETHNYWTSIKAYGPRPHTETLDFPVTLEQLQSILIALRDQSEPAQRVTFDSLRPGKFKAGYEFKVKVTGKCDATFTAISVSSRYISPFGQKGNHLVLRSITMGTKRVSLADTLSSFKTSYELQKTVISRGNDRDAFQETFFLSFGIDNNYLNAPVALSALNVTDTSFTALWTAPEGYPTGASGYYFDSWDSEDNVDPDNPTVYIWHNKQFGEITNASFEDKVVGKTRRYRLRAFNATLTSVYSNIIDILDISNWFANSTDWTFKFNLGGSASITASQLTLATPGNSGAAWYNTRLPISRFTVNFTITTVNQGITFTVHNDSRNTTALGDPAGGLSAYETSDPTNVGITPALHVEYDSFINGGWESTNGIGINLNGSPAPTVAGNNESLTGSMKITYDGTDLKVYKNTVLILTYTINLQTHLLNPSDGKAIFGFTAGGGSVINAASYRSY
jgi:hypothetical protein